MNIAPNTSFQRIAFDVRWIQTLGFSKMICYYTSRFYEGGHL